MMDSSSLPVARIPLSICCAKSHINIYHQNYTRNNLPMQVEEMKLKSRKNCIICHASWIGFRTQIPVIRMVNFMTFSSLDYVNINKENAKVTVHPTKTCVITK